LFKCCGDIFHLGSDIYGNRKEARKWLPHYKSDGSTSINARVEKVKITVEAE